MNNHTTAVKIKARQAQIKALNRISRRVERSIRHAYDRLVELEQGE